MSLLHSRASFLTFLLLQLLPPPFLLPLSTRARMYTRVFTSQSFSHYHGIHYRHHSPNYYYQSQRYAFFVLSLLLIEQPWTFYSFVMIKKRNFGMHPFSLVSSESHGHFVKVDGIGWQGIFSHSVGRSVHPSIRQSH